MKSTKILALIMALLLLVSAMFVLASCYDNEDDKDKQSSSTEPSSSSESTTSTTKADRHTVTIVDGITGKTLETLKVRNNSTVTLTNNYTTYHYGYNIDTLKLMAELSAKVTADKTITIDFVEAPVYTITLQKADKSVFNTYDFEFKERLTKEEIQTGKDTLKFVGDDKNDFNTKTLNGEIKVYGGMSISLSLLPNGPISPATPTFDKWILLDTNGNLLTPFTGSNIQSNLTLRAQYKDGGVVSYADESLKDMSDTDVFNNIHIATRNGKEYILDAEAKGHSSNNEKVTFGDGTQRATRDAGTFRYIHGLCGNIWVPDSSLARSSSNPEENKYTGVLSNDPLYKDFSIQIDQNSYMAFDGDKLYVISIIRDDTPQYLSDTEIATYMAMTNKPTSLFNKRDTAEIYFYFGASAPEVYRINDGEPVPVGRYWKAGDTRDSSGVTRSASETEKLDGLRAINVDRSGRIVTNAIKEPEALGTHSMYDYVDIIDISGSSSDNRKTLKLTDSEGNENGYAIGMVFRVQEYFDAIGYDWTANMNMCKMVFAMQINDQQCPTKMTKIEDNSVEEIQNVFDTEGYKNFWGAGCGMVSAGTQLTVDGSVDITLIKSVA